MDQDWKTYDRTGAIEAYEFKEGMTLDERVSISAADRDAGSPKTGDMIARNPRNADDQWLIAADYFAAHYKGRSQ